MQITPPVSETKIFRIKVFEERLKHREIWINGPIDESLIESLYTSIIRLEQENQQLPITVAINSSGGNFYEAIVATDIMGTTSCPVKTIALANALSGGFILFMGGKERICHDYSCLMMHSVGITIATSVPAISGHIEYTKQAMAKMAKFFAYQTGGRTDTKYWENIFESGKEKWFPVDEALSLGIVHKVIRRPEMVDPNFSIRRPHEWDILDTLRAQQ